MKLSKRQMRSLFWQPYGPGIFFSGRLEICCPFYKEFLSQLITAY